MRRELLTKLFSLAQRAPSDWNLQPLRWLVLRGADDRARFKPLAHGREEIDSAPVIGLALADTDAWRRVPDYPMEQADSGKLTAAEREAQRRTVEDFFGPRPERAREFAVRNSMLALMTLILAARAEGLASGFVGTCDEAGIRREFRIPERWAVAMILTLGYPAEEPPPTLRKPLAEVVDRDEFQSREAV